MHLYLDGSDLALSPLPEQSDNDEQKGQSRDPPSE